MEQSTGQRGPTVATTGGVPLRRNQQEIYLQQLLHPDSCMFNIGALLRIRGPIDMETLSRALCDAIAAHPGMRAVVFERGGVPMQGISPVVPTAVPIVDLSRAADPERAMQRYVEEDFARPFRFGRENPLAAFVVLTTGPERFFIYAKYHHIAFDGWATSLYHQGVVGAYNARSQGRPVEITAGSAWANSVAGETKYLASKAYQRDLEYWRGRLAGQAARLFQPLRSTLTSERHSVFLPQGLFERVRAISGELKATPFHFTAAVFAAWLGRIGRSADVSIGLPILGRRSAAERKTIGFYASMLPLRVALAPDDSAASLTREICRGLKRDYRHNRFPQAGLREGEARTRSPYEVSWSYEEHDYGSELVGCESYVDVLHAGQQIQPIKAYLRVFAERHDVRLDIDVNRGYFDAARARALPGELIRLLTSAVESPDVPLARMGLLSAAERRAETVEVNPPGRYSGSHRTLVEWFEQSAEAHGERTAICDTQGQPVLDYRGLDERANRLARRLRELGVGRESRVGLCLGREPELIVAIIAVLKAGGCYVPLDPGYPAERMALLLGDSGVEVVVCKREHAERGFGDDVRVVALDEPGEADAIGRQSAARLGLTIVPEQAAYVIYTSGSTGRPKGCVVQHSNATALMESTQDQFAFGPEDVWTMFHSYAFDFSVWEVWGALLHGGRVVVVPWRVSRSPQEFATLVRECGVTVLNQTPSAFWQVMEGLWGGGHRLRAIVFGGEKLEIPRLERWYERHGEDGPLLVNMYGITETTVHVTYRALGPEDAHAGGDSVIGAPLGHLRAYVLDEWMEPVPRGVTGELYVGGAGVSRGYLGQPGLTAARFVPDPYGNEAGGRLYRTGDLARRLEDGTLVYQGRADHQVKVRGFRIEPGEIQATLCTHPEVVEALVVPDPDGGGQEVKRLVAYVVAGGDEKPAAGALREFLLARLPEYMVPQAYVMLEGFPLNHNGKLDRAALPAPEEQAGDGATEEYVAPRTEIERQLAAIWQGVLGLSRVGATDNFFTRGGDSILALAVLAEASDRGWRLELHELYEHHTVEALARRLEDGAGNSAEKDKIPPFALISQEDRRRLPADAVDAMPLSSLQAGMLFHAQMGGSIFHDVFSYELEIPWITGRWREVLDRMTQLHPALRTSFHWSDFAQPVQIVHRGAQIPCEITDLRQLAPDDQERAIQAWLAEERTRDFDHGTAALLRVHVHRRGEERLQLTISFQHAILDGWSVARLLTQLIEGYLGRDDGASLTQEPADWVFRRFLALELDTEAQPVSTSFWNERLPVETVKLPRDGRIVESDGERSVRRHEVGLDRELAEGLSALAQRLGVPVKTLLCAAHLRVMGFASGNSHPVTGYTLHGRPEITGAEGALGLFLNTIPMGLRLDEAESWDLLVRRLWREEQAVLAHRHFPLAAIKRLNHGQMPFEVGFNFVHFHAYRTVLAHTDVVVHDIDIFEETDFAFLAQFLQHPASRHLELTLIYDIRQFSAPKVASWGRAYLRALRDMVANAAGSAVGCELMDPEERQQVTVEANPVVDIPQEPTTLVVWFEDTAARFGERPALCAIDGSVLLDYRTLDRRANQLARRLVAFGVTRGCRVGVYLDREADLVVTLLAVLKAGGCYVPLDPRYPSDRLAWLIEDSGMSVVVSKSEQASHLVSCHQRLLLLDEPGEASAIAALADHAPGVSIAPEQAAYVIYTSGSTGQPKGCVVEHRNVTTLMIAAQNRFDFGPEDVWTLFHSYAFDFSVWEMWGALLFGGRVIVVPWWVSRSPQAFAAVVQNCGVTVLNQTPSAFRQVMELLDAERNALRAIVFGGEALQTQGLAPWYEHHADGAPALINMFGITETTVHVTYRELCRADTAAGEGSPIGVPLDHLRVYVLDEFMNPVPLGVTGELYVGGLGVSRGYLGRPSLTAERFVPDAISGHIGARLYRTGDRALRRPDGSLEYTGRADNQIKVRGFRIEPGEIEVALCGHPQVEKALVLALPGPGQDRRLVAYLVSAKLVTAGELRRFLLDQLPEYMVPQSFVVVDEFPLNHHGKVDRAALPPPGEATTDEYVTPRTETERRLAALWKRVLGVTRVGATDNFFAVGGDSILATRLIAEIQEDFGVDLPLRAIFEQPDIERIASVVDGMNSEPQRSEQPRVRRAARRMRRVSMNASGKMTLE